MKKKVANYLKIMAMIAIGCTLIGEAYNTHL